MKPNPNTITKVLERFDEEFLEEYHKHDKCSEECGKKYAEEQIRNGFKQFLRTELTSILEGLKEEIEEIKVAVQEHHGTYKYDDCYEQCQRRIDAIIKE